MKRNKKLSEMSIYEMSEFQNEYEFGEFNDVQEIRNMQFALEKNEYVGIDNTDGDQNQT